jgi:hypothetical protein
MDTATDRSRGRGGLDRIESDGGTKAQRASSLASGIQTRKHGGVRWQPRLPCAQHWQPS